MDLSVKIGSKVLPNPIGVASGTFGYGTEYAELCDLSKIGAIYTKAITLEPRAGNPTPRLAETPSGMINAIGLANVGVEKFLSEKMNFLSTLDSAVIPNVSGSTFEDYETVVEKLEVDSNIWGYEINISCPNVKHGAMAFGTDPKTVEELTTSLRKRTKKPLIIKLSPNVTDITEIAKAAETAGADAVSCINTLVGMVIDINKKRPVLANKTGGLSGPAVKPVAVAMTYKVCRAVNIPVVGLGGIMNANDAIEFLLAGASAIQIGTANFVDPQIPEQVLSGIETYMEREGLSCIKDFHSLLD